MTGIVDKLRYGHGMRGYISLVGVGIRYRRIYIHLDIRILQRASGAHTRCTHVGWP